jgi:GT2 family glycosyltransferase
MEISIIISTLYKRPKELRECLESILNQSVKPLEVILINSNPNREVEKPFEELFKHFRNSGIAVKRIHIPNSSLPHARNTGVRFAKGNIILFIDDDVILDREYLKYILRTYYNHPDAMGVQGFITNRISKNNPLIKWSILKFIWWLLQRGYYEVGIHRQLPSLYEVLPYQLTKSIRRESFSGTNMSFRREVFNHLEFDERLKKYAIGEDKDFSYRIHRLFPGSLYQTPNAKLIHVEAPGGRLPSKQYEFMKQIYHLYLFYKLFDHTIENKLRYVLGRIGDLVLQVLIFIKSGFKKEKAIKIIYMFDAMKVALLNKNRIKKGDINFWWSEV